MIEVSGRTYPVEVRYRPLADPDDPEEEPKDQLQGIVDAVTELSAAGPGDILVFLAASGRSATPPTRWPGQDGLEVLPLYARLSRPSSTACSTGSPARRVALPGGSCWPPTSRRPR